MRFDRQLDRARCEGEHRAHLEAEAGAKANASEVSIQKQRYERQPAMLEMIKDRAKETAVFLADMGAPTDRHIFEYPPSQLVEKPRLIRRGVKREFIQSEPASHAVWILGHSYNPRHVMYPYPAEWVPGQPEARQDGVREVSVALNGEGHLFTAEFNNRTQTLLAHPIPDSEIAPLHYIDIRLNPHLPDQQKCTEHWTDILTGYVELASKKQAAGRALGAIAVS